MHLEYINVFTFWSKLHKNELFHNIKMYLNASLYVRGL